MPPMRGLGGAPASDRPMGRPQVPEADMPAEGQADAQVPEGAEQASPEEQELYNRFVQLFMLALYDEKLLPKTAEFLRNAPDPVAAVAEVAASLGMRVYTFAKEKGTNIPGDVLLHAGREAVPLVAEVAEGAGAAEFDDAMIEAAFYAAADLFAKDAREMGIYGQEMAQEDLAQLDRMAENGELDWMLGEVSKAQQGGMPPGGPRGRPPGGEQQPRGIG